MYDTRKHNAKLAQGRLLKYELPQVGFEPTSGGAGFCSRGGQMSSAKILGGGGEGGQINP